MKSEEKNLFDRIKTMKKAGLAGKQLIPGANLFPCDAKNHLKAVLHFLQNIKQIKIDEMYCFIMYDIESNRVRNYISKYLIRKGCMRVQKSVFVACLKKENYQKIYTTLK
ncbi:MAG: CRISPR-associated endonuclease Cas2 [Bacteroidales bacterium]|nr:CRISPR-associated endonuclease Cas2 [Bacteroidales bacterium]